ncbi:hypothetical protein [Muricoccus radiodurans]|uniref:hypothetical protein n=1 Tax=Muricoccus radiodurans TaxID=2231721 RepID=UPI003CEFBEAE
MLKALPDSGFVMMQSADPVNYFDLLRVTAKANRAYCLRHGIPYLCAHTVMRGFHPLHACYNRVFFLNDLLDLGFQGWFLHLDADAYVADLGFDIAAHLADRPDRSFVITHGATAAPWDVNDGIFFANCAHPDTHRLARRWQHWIMTLAPERLRASPDWGQVPDDQHLLHGTLRETPDLTAAFEYASKDFMNTDRARFIRQVLRARERDLARRVDLVALDVERVLAAHGAAPDPLLPAMAGIARALGQPVPDGAPLMAAAAGDRDALVGVLEGLIRAARRTPAA